MLTEREQSFAVWAILGSIGCVFCGVMWLRKPEPKTVERVVEVPVERIVEKPVERAIERVVDRPVEVIPKAYREAYDLKQRILNAPAVQSDEEVFWNLKEVRVVVLINEVVKKFVGEDELRNKFELILRRNGVPVSDDAACPTSCVFIIEGFTSEGDLRLTYISQVKLRDNVWLFRDGEPKFSKATFWEKSGFGYAGSKVAKQTLMEDAEARAEAFANAYLKTNVKR